MEIYSYPLNRESTANESFPHPTNVLQVTTSRTEYAPSALGLLTELCMMGW